MPIEANLVYKKKGSWTNWDDFLGAKIKNTEQLRKPKTGWASYEVAKKYVQSRNLKSILEWKNDYSKLPNNIPKKPENTYKEWEGWPIFLGTAHNSFKRRANNTKKNWMSYQLAKNWIQIYKINTEKEFKKLKNSVKIPFNFPLTPKYVYRSEWEGWPIFLGYQKKQKKKTYF